jgi:hypothetical protein
MYFTDEDYATMLRFEVARSVADRAGQQIEKRFRSRLEKLLDEGELAEARELVRALPSDCVEVVFMMDTLRQAELGKWKKKG